MLVYLILAILVGFIAVAIIRSRPKPQPKVTKEETLKCDNPEPVVPAPEEVPKETLKCDKPKPAISIPENMTLPERLKFEQGLRKQGFNFYERVKYRKREKIEYYLNADALDSYMGDVVVMQYCGYRSEAEMLHSPGDYTYVSVSESILLLNELYSSSRGQELGIKSRYVAALKNLLQSDKLSDYYAALDYIYNHLLFETNPNSKLLKISDDAELYKIFKDSIPKHIDFLKAISVFEAERLGCTLYEFTEKIDKMFCSAFEQRKLPVPE